MLICGMDEAARGPLLGPLVMCGVIIDEKDIPMLEKLGVKDSKKLLPNKRRKIYLELKEKVKYKFIVVEAEEIDRALNSADLNLNWLEAHKSAEILNELKPEKAIVDCPSNNIAAYHSYLGKLLKVEMELQLEHDAERFLPVAAASIIAKETREEIIEKMKEKYGDFGSGYPSDPKTKAYLKENWKKYPEIFRTTWASYKKISQKSLLDF